jgi:hypothetical protein
MLLEAAFMLIETVQTPRAARMVRWHQWRKMAHTLSQEEAPEPPGLMTAAATVGTTTRMLR